ncbi:MAG: ERCC4 domain-containing protein, partial [Candidatus Altarchaeaceae archaeon]
VDYVIFYEPIPSEIRTIQRRGRTGRGESGEIIILMTKGTRDEGYYWNAITKEKKMRAYLKKIKKDDKADNFIPKGQQSILTYVENDKNNKNENNNENKNIKIYMDVREKSAGLHKILREKCLIEIKHLEVGDYILSEDVCVERKTGDDFLQSIVDKRLLEQGENLARNFRIPIIIIEGELDYSSRNIHPNAIRGIIAALICDFGISIIQTRDVQETAEIIYAIAKREQEEKKKVVALRGEKKAYTLAERQRFVVESLPYVSAVLARRLLNKFKTISRIANASTKELMKVEEIGKKKAEEIYKVLHEEYKEE